MTATASSAAVASAADDPIARTVDSYFVPIVMQKGGVGKTMFALGLTMICVDANGRAILWDTDPQQTSYDTSRTLIDPGYEVIYDQDPDRLAAIRAQRRVDTIFGDCPGSLEGDSSLAGMAKHATFALLPYDGTIEAMRPLVRTSRRLRELGTPHAAVANLVPPGKQYEEPHMKEVRSFCANQQIPLFQSYVREYTAWQNALRARLPITRHAERYASRVAGDLRNVHGELLINIGRLR